MQVSNENARQLHVRQDCRISLRDLMHIERLFKVSDPITTGYCGPGNGTNAMQFTKFAAASVT